MLKRDTLPKVPSRRKSLELVDDSDDEEVAGSSSNDNKVQFKKRKQNNIIQSEHQKSTKLLAEQFKDTCFIRMAAGDKDAFSYFPSPSPKNKDKSQQHQSRFDALFDCTTASLIMHTISTVTSSPKVHPNTPEYHRRNAGMHYLRETKSCPRNLGTANKRQNTTMNHHHRSCQSMGNRRPSLSTIKEFQSKTCFDDDYDIEIDTDLSMKAWHGVETNPTGPLKRTTATCALRRKSKKSIRSNASSSSSFSSLSSFATSTTTSISSVSASYDNCNEKFVVRQL